MPRNFYVFVGSPLMPSRHSRVKTEEDTSDLQDLVMSFFALEEKVLEQYTYAKVFAEMHSKFILNS